ncbi:MAG TPA: S41 family peptidase [Candidatus Paceibacterota bacterium]|nr:S41 family peptidase [Candidatus Paceibacterota bacterium]
MCTIARIFVYAIFGLFMPLLAAEAVETDPPLTARNAVEAANIIMEHHMPALPERCRPVLVRVLDNAASRKNVHQEWLDVYNQGCIGGRAELADINGVQIAKSALYKEWWSTPAWQYDKVQTKVWAKMIGEVRYINLKNFYESDLRVTLRALATEKPLPSGGYIVDMRGSGGGYIWAAHTLGMLFAKNTAEPVMFRTTRQGTDSMVVEKPGELSDKPLVVLVDQDSASTAEMAVCMLTQNKAARGVLMGKKTHGKGNGAWNLQIPGKLRITYTRYTFSCPGKDGKEVLVDGKGIEPDIRLPDADLKVTSFTENDKAITAALQQLAVIKQLAATR